MPHPSGKKFSHLSRKTNLFPFLSYINFVLWSADASTLDKSKTLSFGRVKPLYISRESKPFPKRQILDSSKLKGFADDHFIFNENGRIFSLWVENTVGKGEIARYEHFLLLPQCFHWTCTADTKIKGFV